MMKIGDELAYLELGALQPDGRVMASLVAQGLHAATPIDPYEDHVSGQSLTTYFAHLERLWRGWDGAETWETLEGEFRVRARHSGSHVHLDTEIRTYGLRVGREWAVQLEIVIDPGEQLSRAVSDLRDAFPATPR